VGVFIQAVDSTGATIDFLLSAKRDAAATERFLAKAWGGENHPAPRVINTDKHAAYPPAIAEALDFLSMPHIGAKSSNGSTPTLTKRVFEKSRFCHISPTLFPIPASKQLGRTLVRVP
jgi:transposase-like protein